MTIHPQTRIGTVHLIVRDLDSALKFYQQALGFHVNSHTENLVRLGVTAEDLLVLEGVPDATQAERSTGLYHFAVLMPSRQELACSLYRLVDFGWKLSGVADHAVSEALYLSDPEGNGIELYRDRERADWPMQDGKLAMYNAPLDLDSLLAESERSTAAGEVHPQTRMGHIHLRASSIPENLDFYVNLLGFDLMQEYGPSAAFVSAGGYHHHIGMNTWESRGAPPAPEGSLGLKQFEILLPDEEALQSVLDRLQEEQLPLEQTELGWGVCDPAGVRLLLNTRSAA